MSDSVHIPLANVNYMKVNDLGDMLRHYEKSHVRVSREKYIALTCSLPNRRHFLKMGLLKELFYV
jgi:hypothetical protein